MMLPPGGFLMIGMLLLVANWHDLRKVARAKTIVRTVAPAKAPARDAEEVLV
jgi:hypothetical protein